MGSFVHCNVQYLYFYFLMLLFMNNCNDFAPCGPSIGQYKFLFLFLYYENAYLMLPRIISKLDSMTVLVKYS
jgi:hypothetical protein